MLDCLQLDLEGLTFQLLVGAILLLLNLMPVETQGAAILQIKSRQQLVVLHSVGLFDLQLVVDEFHVCIASIKEHLSWLNIIFRHCWFILKGIDYRC